MGRIFLVVGLHLVGDAVWDVQVRHIDADEKRAVVVRSVPRGRFDVVVASDADVKGAVQRSVIRVHEPHGSREVELLTGGDPTLVGNVVAGQFTVVVTDLEVPKTIGTVGEELPVGLKQRRTVPCRA